MHGSILNEECREIACKLANNVQIFISVSPGISQGVLTRLGKENVSSKRYVIIVLPFNNMRLRFHCNGNRHHHTIDTNLM